MYHNCYNTKSNKLPLHLWSFLLRAGVPLKLSYGMPVWVSVIYISWKDNMICYDEAVGRANNTTHWQPLFFLPQTFDKLLKF